MALIPGREYAWKNPMERSFLTESERIKTCWECKAEVGTKHSILQDAETSDNSSDLQESYEAM